MSGLLVDSVKNNRLQDTEEDFFYTFDESSEQAGHWCSWNIQTIITDLQSTRKPLVNVRGNRKGAANATTNAVFRTLITDRDPSKSKRRQLMELSRPNNDNDDELWPTDLEEYLPHAQLWTQKRTLILSAAHTYLGLAPSATLPGDQICILHGFHAPVILRPCGIAGGGTGANDDSLSYTVIGNAYIHGLMDGEAMSEKSLVQTFAEQRFVLR